MMRAKMVITDLVTHSEGQSATLTMRAICPKEGYGNDGVDENNSFARWTPNASLVMTVNNPALVPQLKIGQTFYVDFTEVAE